MAPWSDEDLAASIERINCSCLGEQLPKVGPQRQYHEDIEPYHSISSIYHKAHVSRNVSYYVSYHVSCASASVVQTAVRFFREGAEPLGHEQIPVAMGHPSWGSQMGFM